MDQTPNLNLPIPNADAVPPTNISDEFPRIALALTMLDEIIHTLQGVVAGKAETDHSQAISTITGLVDALAAKMPADTTFSLDDLTDVQGAADALVNYVLVKKASGQWEPSSALAALGIHNHAISEIVGLSELLVDIADALAEKANKAITITGGGLATGGGDLSGNRVISVPKATETQAQNRSDDNVALTPLTGDKLAAARDTRLLHVRDQKPNGTDAGAAVVDGQVRVLNTVVVNNIAGASLAANRITLPAGTYEIDARVPAYSTNRTKVWLRLAGGSVPTPIVNGSSTYANQSTSVSAVLFIRGRFTLAATTELEVLMHCQTAVAGNGLGVGSLSANASASEVYTDVMIWKVD